MDALDLLLKMDLPSPEEKEIKIKRLSRLCGEDVIFRLRQLSYSRVEEIRKANSEDVSIHILLSGVVSPSFKNTALREKYGAETPAELVKKLLLPGEIEDISRTIERMCGYRTETIEDIKKK